MARHLGREPSVEMVAGRPHAGLREFVGGYTGYRITGAAPGLHRGLPSRHLTLVLTIEGTVDLVALPDPVQPPASFSALAGGLNIRPVLISHDGWQHGLQISLTPGGCRALLGLPAGELAHTVVDLRTLLGPQADELVGRLRVVTTWTERFAELDRVLTHRATHVTDRTGASGCAGLSPELGWAWRRLAANHGRISVATLATEIGWSRRHLGARFRHEFGLTPKTAARVMRFELAQRLLRSPDRPDLATVATRCGCYDQAHLHREWRELAGCSPSRWLAEEAAVVAAEAVGVTEAAGAEFPFVHDNAPDAGAR